MTYADFDFYQNEYKGIIITDGGKYGYFSERAGDELAPFVKMIPQDDGEAQSALKKCACAIADILYGDFNQSKNGFARINSESVNGYYSVSYSAVDDVTLKKKINANIVKYIGAYITCARKVVI